MLIALNRKSYVMSRKITNKSMDYEFIEYTNKKATTEAAISMDNCDIKFKKYHVTIADRCKH